MVNLTKTQSFLLAMLITSVYLGIGVGFLFEELADYSWILFILLPLCLGVSIGMLPNKKTSVYATLLTTFVILIALYIPGLSGLLCIFMALPIIIPVIILGYAISNMMKRRKKMKDTTKFHLLMVPFIPFLIAAPTEHYLKTEKQNIIEVRTERIYNYTPDQVYDAIKSVDTLIAEKSFLMSFDLPVPTKCILEKEEVGGIRTCYFDAGEMSNADFGAGTITERITQLERGKVLKMDVIDYKLVGRKWLGFKEAIYYFDKAGEGSCKLTRITTYTSVLSPRFYWEPLEKLGVSQEHDYVFDNLQSDLEKKYGEK